MKKISRILLLLGIACCSFGTYAETKASARGNDLKLLSLEEFKNLDPKERGEYYGKLIRLRIVMEFVQNRMIMEATGEEAFSASNWDIRRMQFLDLLMRASTMDSQASTSSTGVENLLAKVGHNMEISGTALRSGLRNFSEDFEKLTQAAGDQIQKLASEARDLVAARAATKAELTAAEKEVKVAKKAEAKSAQTNADGTIEIKAWSEASNRIKELKPQISTLKATIAQQSGELAKIKEALQGNDLVAVRALEKSKESLANASGNLERATQNFLDLQSSHQVAPSAASYSLLAQAKEAVEQATKQQADALAAYNRSIKKVEKQIEISNVGPQRTQLDNLAKKEAKVADAATQEVKAANEVVKSSVWGNLAAGAAAAVTGTAAYLTFSSPKAKATSEAAPAANPVGAAAPAAPATAERPDAKADPLKDGDVCLYGGQTGKMKGGKCNRPDNTKCSPPKNGFQCGNYGISDLKSRSGRLCVALHPLANLTLRCGQALERAISSISDRPALNDADFKKLVGEINALISQTQGYCVAKNAGDDHSGCSALGRLVDNLNKEKNASAAKPADKAKDTKGMK